jgi:hypothetical protein
MVELLKERRKEEMRIKIFLMAVIFGAVSIFGGMSIVDLQPETIVAEAAHDWNKFNRNRYRKRNRRRVRRPHRRRHHDHPGCFIGTIQVDSATNLVKRIKEIPDWQIHEADKDVYAYTSRKTKRDRRNIRKMYRLSRRRGGGGGCFINTIQE